MYCRDNGNSLEIFSLLLMKEYVCFIIFRVLSMAVYDLSYFYWNIFSHTFFFSLLFNVHVENFSEVNNITNPPMYCDFFSSFFFLLSLIAFPPSCRFYIYQFLKMWHICDQDFIEYFSMLFVMASESGKWSQNDRFLNYSSYFFLNLTIILFCRIIKSRIRHTDTQTHSQNIYEMKWNEIGWSKCKSVKFAHAQIQITLSIL